MNACKEKIFKLEMALIKCLHSLQKYSLCYDIMSVYAYQHLYEAFKLLHRSTKCNISV